VRADLVGLEMAVIAIQVGATGILTAIGEEARRVQAWHQKEFRVGGPWRERGDPPPRSGLQLG